MGGFAKYERNEVNLPAWQALTPAAREVYMRMKLQCFAQGGKKLNNNGAVFRSPRQLARETGLSVKTVSAGLADLQAKGWLVVTGHWALGDEGKGKTATFRLTMLPSGAKPPFKPPTREPEAWREGRDFEVKVYASYLPKPRKGRIERIQKNKIPNPNRAHHCALTGRTQYDDLPDNVIEVRPNRKHIASS